jgi:hypothetical protein
VTAPNAHLEQLVLSLFTGRRLDLVLELDDGLKVGVILRMRCDDVEEHVAKRRRR